MSAHDSSTVDWSWWMFLSHDEQQALLATYRSIVKKESDEALMMNYSRMDQAMFPNRRRR